MRKSAVKSASPFALIFTLPPHLRLTAGWKSTTRAHYLGADFISDSYSTKPDGQTRHERNARLSTINPTSPAHSEKQTAYHTFSEPPQGRTVSIKVRRTKSSRRWRSQMCTPTAGPLSSIAPHALVTPSESFRQQEAHRSTYP